MPHIVDNLEVVKIGKWLSGDHADILYGVAASGDLSGSSSRLKHEHLGLARPNERQRPPAKGAGCPGGEAGQDWALGFFPAWQADLPDGEQVAQGRSSQCSCFGGNG